MESEQNFVVDSLEMIYEAAFNEFHQFHQPVFDAVSPDDCHHCMIHHVSAYRMRICIIKDTLQLSREEIKDVLHNQMLTFIESTGMF